MQFEELIDTCGDLLEFEHPKAVDLAECLVRTRGGILPYFSIGSLTAVANSERSYLEGHGSDLWTETCRVLLKKLLRTSNKKRYRFQVLALLELLRVPSELRDMVEDGYGSGGCPLECAKADLRLFSRLHESRNELLHDKSRKWLRAFCQPLDNVTAVQPRATVLVSLANVHDSPALRAGCAVRFVLESERSAEPFVGLEAERLSEDFIHVVKRAERDAYGRVGLLRPHDNYTLTSFDPEPGETLPGIEGSSGYLAFASAHALRLDGSALSPLIALTGCLDMELGHVTGAGDLDEKITAAVNHGVRYLLVPSGQLQKTTAIRQRLGVDSEIEVLGVEGYTLQEQVESAIGQIRELQDMISAELGTELGLQEEYSILDNDSVYIACAAAVLKDACEEVDVLTTSDRAFLKSRWVDRLLEEKGISDAYVDGLLSQVRLSYYNHQADSVRASQVYKDFVTSVEPDLRPAENSQHWMLIKSVRHRWAVALRDQFRLEEARGIIAGLKGMMDRTVLEARRRGGDDLSSEIKREVAAVYGELGQLRAMIGGEDNQSFAEEMFRAVFEISDEDRDREREWVYLTHLAVDAGGDRGERLWAEARENLPFLRDSEPRLDSAGQVYQFCALVKGVAAFGSHEELSDLCCRVREADPFALIAPNELSRLEFGLAFQDLGIAFDRLSAKERDKRDPEAARRSSEEAQAWLRRSEELFLEHSRRSKLACLLQHFAKLRLELSVALQNRSPEVVKGLESAVSSVSSFIELNYDSSVWETHRDGSTTGLLGETYAAAAEDPEERALSLLDCLRFNYW